MTLIRVEALAKTTAERSFIDSVKERFVDLNLRAFQIGADYVSEAAYY